MGRARWQGLATREGLMSKEAQYVPELTWEQKGKLSSRPPKWSQEDHEHAHQPESLEQGPSPAGMRPKGRAGGGQRSPKGVSQPQALSLWPSQCQSLQSLGPRA